MKENYKRVQLDMSEDTFAFLDELKEKTRSSSRAEVIKNAMIVFDYLVEYRKKNYEIYARNGNGTEEKIVLPIIVSKD